MLFHRLDSISQNLHKSLHTHSRQAHEDIAIALLEHARMNIMYERSVLKELEVLRNDVKAITAVGPAAIRRANIPPALERKESLGRTAQQAMPPTRAWVEQPRAQPPPNSTNPNATSQQSQQQPRPPQQQYQQQMPQPSSSAASNEWKPRNPTIQNRPNPAASSSSSASAFPQDARRQPSDLTQSLYQPTSSSSGFRPSPSPATPSFVPPSRQQQYQPQPQGQPRYPQQQPSSSSGAFDPLGGGGGSLPPQRNEPMSNGSGGSQPFDPRGGGQMGGQGGMTQSYYVPPTQQPAPPQRKRLDPREAARAFAKGF